MALNNSQYNELMREYEERQRKNRHEREARIREVYRRLPEVEAVDRSIGERSADCARRVLGGDAGAREELKRELLDLRRRKERLLREAGFPADYMGLRYTCPDCKDTGYANGRRCHCFERARLKLLYAQSGIEDVLKRENFDTLSFAYYDDSREIPGLNMTELAYMRAVVRQCREFAEQFPEKGVNLLFTGGTGVGKTFLTNCIAKTLMDRYVSVIYLTAPDLFETLSWHRGGGADDEESRETGRHVLDCEMLVIDDLGSELNNAFVSSRLFYCINERINRGKGTIISTNLSPNMLQDAYSDRVTSRLASHYKTIPLYGADIRIKKREQAGRAAELL